MFIDSHCHLDLLDLENIENGVQGVLDEAKQHGVNHFLCVSVKISDFPSMYDLISPYENVFASVGLHPNETATFEPKVEDFLELAKRPRIVALGETGLDYYRSEGDLVWQRNRFITHIQAARELELPIIVHTRAAKKDTLDIMRQERVEDISGVLHCFTEDWEMAKKALDRNFYISFSGIVTFKNATDLQDVAKRVPLNRLLIETDSPYLAPNPYRGKPNRPAYVKYVAEFLAGLRGTTVEQIATATTENFFELFKKAELRVK